MLKKYRPFIICFYVLAAGALAAASFVDLKLDIQLNDPTDIFARWFEATGEMPSRLLTTVAGVLLFYLCEKPVMRLFGLLANFGGAAYLGYHLHRYFFRDDLPLAVGIVFGLGIGAIALYIGQYFHVPEQLKNPLIILSVAGIAVLFAQLATIEVTKYLWGRVRFRDLLKQGSYDAFTAWYHPNGLNGNKSFPSGHTAGAAMSYLMLLLPYISKKWEKHRVWCFVLPLVFTSVVAYTRLVMGAHYLSDVTVGGVIGFTAVLIAIKIIDKKFLLHFQLQ
ncbi:MAG: phosphatase PAP2 family protein [Eubacterium sp.]|nr:phosphatase PAP2 family protein [Eubacterium sp.]